MCNESRWRAAVKRRPESITKLDAARRQLRTAVVLFFDYGDDVSVHTLAAAGYQVLIDLVHHQGKRTRLEESAEVVIKPEGHILYKKAIRRAQNFFKHADKATDPDSLLDFHPRETHHLLFACGEAYYTLTGRHLRELWSFLWWFMLEYPGFLKNGPFKDELAAAIGSRTAAHRDRRAFWAAFDRAPSPGCD